ADTIRPPHIRPRRSEWTLFGNTPINAPAISPLSIENVITLVITSRRDGSRNPLKPSANPSEPPRINPRTGFDRLTLFSRKELLRARVRLHHAEKISFGVFAVCEIANSRNRRFRHD